MAAVAWRDMLGAEVGIATGWNEAGNLHAQAVTLKPDGKVDRWIYYDGSVLKYGPREIRELYKVMDVSRVYKILIRNE
jgi:hypothetical protein